MVLPRKKRCQRRQFFVRRKNGDARSCRVSLAAAPSSIWAGRDPAASAEGPIHFSSRGDDILREN